MGGKQKRASAVCFFPSQRLFITNDDETGVGCVANRRTIKADRGSQSAEAARRLHAQCCHGDLRGRDHAS